VHSLAQRVLSHIRSQELLRAGDRVGVAVSGGIDSVALLRLLRELRSELGIVLSVVHFNHKLRGAESDADEAFVSALAHAHDLEFFCDSDDVAQHAADQHVSLETAARELRYGFFRHLLNEGTAPGPKSDSDNPPLRGTEAPLFHVPASSGVRLNKILTGHTLDDQAETVLMRMIRGAGLAGLGGIYPRIEVERSDTRNDNGEICGEIMRPLLAFRRCELEQYLNDIGQSWREDSSNADDSFTRNRVRKLVVPLLQKEFNPAVAENLAELAEIARGEEDYWENEVAGWMGTAVHWSEPEWARPVSEGAGLIQITAIENVSEKIPTSRAQNAREMGDPTVARGHGPFNLRSKIDNAPWLVMNASVDRLWFLGEPIAVQRRLVKAIGEQASIPLEFKHVEEILHFATGDGPIGKHLSLPFGWRFVREPDELVFLTPDLREPTEPQDYEYKLAIPGQVTVPEAGFTLEARTVPATSPMQNAQNLLHASSLSGPLTLRNWRAGDRFWPPHTKAPKKIKELLQERHIPQPQRKLWPVLVSGNENDIVWMRGFDVPTKFQANPGRAAILIVETLNP
jgi:tRNA(Ile)-lysidine synthase